MSKLFKFAVVLFGLALAAIAYTNDVNANGSSSRSIGGCVGSGKCGVTTNGTVLEGKWIEKLD